MFLNRKMWFRLCYLLLIGQMVNSSPFELLEKYIEGFRQNLNELEAYLHSEPKWETKSYLLSDENNIKDIGEYDFIIVGGGASGAVIANRLSEIPDWKILLLEAGEGETPATKVPRMHDCLKSTGSPMTWGYYTVPQNHSCLDMPERRCYIPTAKAMGGTTAINDMLYTRGNPRDYDLWADAGLKGWCTRSLGPYFKNIEDAHLDTQMDHGVHRYGGPVHIESPRYYSDIAMSILGAAQELAIPTIDINGKNSVGFGVPQFMTKNGERFSAAEAYLNPARTRKNLEIKPLTEVTKIIISPHTKEARAVQFLHEKQFFIARASKEIILAAGSINTPKLLLLSGVGSEEDLKSLNIDTIQNLKVGKNLIHHTLFPGLTYYYNEEIVKPPFYYSQEIDYLKNGRGPLASTGIDIVGFLKTDFSKGRQLYPDVQLLASSEAVNNHENHLKLHPDLIETNLSTIKHHHTELRKLTFNLLLLHPKSRGTLKLNNASPHEHPLIDLNDLSDAEDEDLATLLAAVRSTQKLIDTKHLKHLHLHQQPIPNCATHVFNTDDYLKCAIKHLSISSGELMGSAPMGVVSKEGHFGDSVVDLELRVHGIEKLRIADDSVIPVGISGQLAAVKMIIGEKCSDLLKNEWLK